MIRLDPDFAELFDAVASEALEKGIIEDIELVSGYRDAKLQARLYADWRSGRSTLPAAKPGTSFHESGLAVDVAVSPPEALTDFGHFAESRGLRWGGRFDDPVHFDVGDSLTLGEAKARFARIRSAGLVEVS